jgi:hypothetical protein
MSKKGFFFRHWQANRDISQKTSGKSRRSSMHHDHGVRIRHILDAGRQTGTADLPPFIAKLRKIVAK